MACTVDELLAVARSQVGYKESPAGSNMTKYGKWYGMNGQPWCDMFVSWCFAREGATDIGGKFAYTPSHANWFKARKQWGTKPRPGAIAFFDFPDSKNRIQHVGIVEVVRSGYVVCIEGNTSVSSQDNGGAVMRRNRSKYIVGYGYPAYEKEEDMAFTSDDEITVRCPKGSKYAKLRQFLVDNGIYATGTKYENGRPVAYPINPPYFRTPKGSDYDCKENS